MVAGILLRITVIPICYPEWKDWNTEDFKFAFSWLVQVSEVNLKKRDHLYM